MLQLGSSALNRTEGQGHIFIDFVSSVQVYRGHSVRTILLVSGGEEAIMCFALTVHHTSI